MSKKEKNKKVQSSLEELEKSKKSKKDTIAIIGMSGFLPESDAIQDFWEKLDRQECFIKTIPDDHDPENSVKYKKGSFIKNLRGFDAKLFHIISAEAKYMTPHQRLLLMSVWNLFEDACILPSSLEGKKVAVIIGKETNPYMEYLNKAPITTYTCLGMGQGYLPNRISNFFNFKGPSYSLDTSCSGGLTALHQGKELLKNNEVDYVVVAGVNLMYGKEWTRSFFSGSEAMGLITTGKEGSMPFQEEASGFVPSEGVVSFLLKRSNEAVADKDNIHAYVLGSAINHVGGVGNIAFPDAGQQSKAIIAAYEEAAIPPETVTYVEAHAASSTLADAQEIEAFKLADAHFWNTDSEKEVINSCKISTLKPNIGHMHAASGLVSLVRLIYSFKEGKKLGIKDFTNPSNEIGLDDSRYYISAETDEWPRLMDQKIEIPRRGAVNNYGGGGSIVHAVLEEYIPDSKEELIGDSNENVFFLTLSSTEEIQFLPYAKSIKHFLEKNPACSEKQLEYHYLLSRKELNKRIVFRYKSIKDLLEKLIKFIKSEGKLGYYVSGSVDVGASLNELFQKNKKVVAFLNGLQDKNDKSLLFDLWVKGYEEPIKTYFAKESMPKNSFPGYPFHLQPYWLDVYSDLNNDLSLDDKRKSEVNHQFINSIEDKADAISEISSIKEQKQQSRPENSVIENAENIILYEIKDVLRKKLAQLLDVETDYISDQEKFIDMGLDSMSGVEWVRLINEHYNLFISSIKMYDYPTLNRFSEYVQEKLLGNSIATQKLVQENKILLNNTDYSIKDLSSTKKKDISISTTNTKKYTDNQKSIEVDKRNNTREILGDKSRVSYQDIAIIGTAGRFPKSNTISEFWDNIKNGTNCIEKVPLSRWNIDSTTSKDFLTNAQLGTMDDVDKFDPLFFKLSPRAAEEMDPQQRLFLETSWHCFEDAGYAPSKLSNTKCGVFVGCLPGVYGQKMMQDRPSTGSLQGGSSSILSARIAYFLNLTGPCMAIDTACSSSLVALSEACNSLVLGQSDMALTGGVYVESNEDLYLMHTDSNMLSKEGRCFTFDERANGFVAGEGVGCVLLKRLEDAEKDGDNIIGVIKGWGVNQDGATNGITAPSMNSQKTLQTDIYRSFDINPENIQLVEAHGTGTILGDPIEVAALKESFRSFTDKTNFCALGSVKSNIGHLTAAAGIAGLIKVLMALKHKKLPPTINFEKLNSKIELKNSPFYVNTELRDWNIEENQTRSAAISSFGFSGTNSHVVVEEYIKKNITSDINDPAIILLSAKNKERLQIQVSNLLNYLKKNKTVRLHDIAYTLQVGRAEMEERLAFVVEDLEGLKKQLSLYETGDTTALFTGNTKKRKQNLEGETDLSRLNKAIQNKELEALSEFWVKGIALDWNLLYEKDHYPNKISLPQYPFARESYWALGRREESITTAINLHPLLHSNASDLIEHKYESVYTGKESFFSDHIIQGEKIFPGTAYLELARIAGAMSTKHPVKQLKDVVWLSPIKVNSILKEVKIRIYTKDEDIAYEIYTRDQGTENIHSRGKIILEAQDAPSNYDLEIIQNQFTEAKSKAACYALFESMGFDYGTSFRGIETLWYNASAACSKITLPKEENYMLSPGLLDSALQTCIGLTLDKKDFKPSVPFNAKAISIYTEELPETVWSYIKRSSDTKHHNRVINYDIDIFDEEGKVLISFKDFAMLPLSNHSKPVLEETLETHFYTNEWSVSTETTQQRAGSDQLVLIAGGSVRLADKLREALEVDVVVVTGNSEEEYFLNVLKEVKEKTSKRNPLNITLICEYTAYIDYGFISGLLKSVHQENSKITGKVIGVDSLSLQKLSTLVEILETEQSRSDSEVRYIEGVREVKKLSPSLLPLVNETAIIKEGGVYLITGGLGGLGQIFATHISRRKQTKVILIGRSKLTEEKRVFLSSLPNVFYSSCDVSIREDVFRLIDNIIDDYGSIDGIIHAAGSIRDSVLKKKTSIEVNAVLPPKILGIKYLDEATRDKPLDFMVLFSSMASITGNIGQTDYAAGNAYLDNYAAYRERKRLGGERQGITLSINWPLWKEGGMKIDPESEEYLAQKWGIRPMPTDQGISALETLLEHELSQGAVFYGKKTELSNRLLKETVTIPVPAMTNMNSTTDTQLKEAASAYLKNLLSDALKLSSDLIDTTDAFEEYGIDSIMITKLTNKLNETFDDLPATLFFEYQTLDELIGYFVEEHATRLLEVTGTQTNISEEEKYSSIKALKNNISYNSSLSNRLINKTATKSVPAMTNMSSTTDAQLKEAASTYLKNLLSEALKLSSDLIDTTDAFEEYGIDSIMITKLTNKLNETFDDLPATLFFEYQTLDELIGYFVEEHATRLLEVTGTQTNISEEKKYSSIKALKNNISYNSSFSKKTKKEPANLSQEDEPIAIIGLSGKYPQADTIDEFWKNLKVGKNCITEIPKERWDIPSFYDSEQGKLGKSASKWGGFITDVDKFDPLFFNISPREAKLMDPQERLFLQTVWEAVEDAGYTRTRLQEVKNPGATRGGHVGVYAGVMYSEYQLYGVEETQKGNPLTISSSPSSIANRVSYYLNITGPSMGIDTMCSSSLTAIHLATEAIRNNQCSMAIAGGVNVSIHPNKYKLLSQNRFVSNKGQCESFGEGGEGYVPAEGVGAVLLKTLSQAEADGDQIYGVIKGSSLNHGGKTNGYTVPNPNKQAEVIKEAIERAGVKPEDFSYIEAHGTGTSLGDPIEIAGLSKAFKGSNKKGQYCAIGSVKSNIGHAESAAGISGLTKLLLQLKYKKIVPSLHSEVLNKNIKFENTPFKVQQELEDWNTDDNMPRLSGISSFGAGGSNAHIIVEEYCPKVDKPYKSSTPAILLLSARSEKQLREKVASLSVYLKANETIRLHDMAYTLQVGREPMTNRLAFISDTIESVVNQLDNYHQGKIEGVLLSDISSNKNDFLLKGKAGESYLKEAIENKEIENLIQLWVKGVSIDWRLLYGDVKPAIISLPTYPFARDRYWYDTYHSNTTSKTKNKNVIIQSDMNSIWEDNQTQKVDNHVVGKEIEVKLLEGGIALVQMNSKVTSNMLNKHLMRSLYETFKELRTIPELKVVVLTGVDDVFSMGGDQESLFDIVKGESRFTYMPFAYRGLLDFDVPVITAMQGHAFGGGLVFGMYGDIILLSKSSTYSANFMKHGFTPGMGATYILGERLGKQLATEMMYTAKLFSGKDIQNRGGSVIVSNSVLKDALQIAKDLSTKPRKSLEVLKQKMSKYVLSELVQHINDEEVMHEQTIHTEEVAARIEEHFEKATIDKGIISTDVNKNSHSGKTALTFPTSIAAEDVINDSLHLPKEITSVTEQVKVIFSEILHTPIVTLNETTILSDFGVDSISGVEIVQKLNTTFSLSLQATILYDKNTIAALSEHILKETKWSNEVTIEEFKESKPKDVIPETTLSDLSFIHEEYKQRDIVELRGSNIDKTAITKGDDNNNSTGIAIELEAIPTDTSNQVYSFETTVNSSLTSSYAESNVERTNVIEEIKVLFSEILHIPVAALNETTVLSDFGVDSISGVEIIQKINTTFSLSLQATILYDKNTITQLSAHILEETNWSPIEIGTDENNNLKSRKPIEVKLSETRTPAFTDSIASVLEKPTTVSSTPLETTETPAEVSNTDMAIIAISGLFPADLDFDSSENNNKIDLSAPLGNKPWNTIDEKNFLSNSGYAGIEETQLQNLGRQHQLIFSAIGLALKKSGISFQELSGTKTGVFIAANDMVRPSGNSEDQMVMMLPNKVSYHLNLIGPSEYIFSSCTSVYHAIHKAVQSIEQGECDQAIVGGVNIIDEETSRYGGSQDLEKLLSIGKYMRSFDESADGIVRSEGVGVLFLKKKSIAKRDNNKIYGVIRGTSFVHGGKNLSWESPNPKGVKTAIGTSLTKAKIDVDTIDYIEAHGIANPVADAVELSAINAAYKLRTKNPDKKWVIGCTKPLIGHSELASGMASIIKVLSAFERKTLPGIPGLEQVNSELDPDHALLLKNDTAYWKNGTHPRRAGLNSYAVGGANAHIILEEYPQKGSLNDKFSVEENSQVTIVSNQSEIKTTEKEKESGTKAVLLAMTCEVFNIEKEVLDLKRSPIDYDFDSIKVVEFLKKVNNYFNIEVKVGKILVADDFESIFQIFEIAIEKTIATEKNTENTSKSEKVSVIYPLSEGQKGLWFIQKSTPDTTAYNVPLAICLENNPDSQVIYHAAEQILEAHPILRVVFDVESNGTLYQQVQPTKDCLKKDIQSLRKGQNVKEVFEQLLHQPFDLSKEVVRLHVREDKKNKKTFVLFLIHHIVVDGMSTTLFFTEFVKQFKQLTTMKKGHPISLDTQYFEFVNWEHQYMKSKRGAQDIAYWKEKLKGNIERLELPYDTIPKIDKVENIGSGMESIDLGREQLESLISVAKSMKVNISVLLLSVFKVFMYRLTSKQDIIVSIPTIGRPKQEYGHSIGYYINMMLSRSQVSGSQTFASFVENMRSSFNTDMDFLSYPYPKLLTELEINKQGGHDLFPVSFYYQNIFEELLQEDISQDVQLIPDVQQEITEEYTLEIINQKDRLTFQLKYRKDLFLEETIKRHLKSFHNLLKEVIANPEIKISQIALLDDDQKNRLLFDFNTTETEYPRDKCIHELFADQVKKTPEAIAVAFAEETITYSELEKRSRQLAIYLQQQGVEPDTLVGVYMERSIDMVVAILSIIRSGGAYVPFDLAYPLERNSYMLQDSIVKGNKGVKLMLTQEHLHHSAKDFIGNEEVTMILLTSDWKANDWLSTINQALVQGVIPENLIYVIYTSGSTGKPKGVMVNHKSVVNFMCSMQADYELGIKDSMIGVTPISFDIHALELYLPLITGAKLAIIPREIARSAELLKSAIIKQHGTIMQATPVTWRMLLESNWQPSHDFIALCGGEAMPKEVREGLRLLPLVDAWNMYGPTETTIWSCTEQLKTSDTDTIGKPIANTQIYMLNENGLALQMVGAIGELCIGGDGLARGYLNRTELTAEKFIDNPYGEGKLYRTGDLAKWLPNGTIQFLGRIDHQVKIRGHRIELGEIETLLNGYQDIHTSVVVSKEHAGTQQLVAYCVLENKDMELGVDLVNRYLSRYLPEYMVPSFIIPIEEIPLTSNGKVDRKVLQSKELNIISNAIYIAPETDTEKELVKIWQEVLQVGQIGIEDNFLDMGGNSELSVVLAQKIKIQFEKEISVVEVFQYPTIKSFVKFLDKETPKNEVLEKSKRRAEKRRKALLGGE